MKKFLLITVILFIVSACHVSNDFDLTEQEATKYKDVFELAKPNQVTVIEYFGPWCGRCYDMKEVLSDLQRLYPDIKIITINCNKDYNRKFMEFDFNVYPYIAIFKSDSIKFRKEATMTTKELSDAVMIAKFNGLTNEIIEKGVQ